MAPDIAVPTVQVADITKTYPGGVIANDEVALAAFAGEIHAIVGENGAGKSTLASILYGIVEPDRGRVRIRGVDVRIGSPQRAMALGIGLVSQHTNVISALTLWENAALCAGVQSLGWLSRDAVVEAVTRAAGPIAQGLPWDIPAGQVSVATLQRVEIARALWRGAQILILDEPTAALAPGEAAALFEALHGLAARGATILLITHRLREVMAHCARVTVLREGRSVAERLVPDTTQDELLAWMIGPRSGGGTSLIRETSAASAPATMWHGPRDLAGDAPSGNWMAPRPSGAAAPPLPRLEVEGLTVRGDRGNAAAAGCSLSVRAGEIVGIAGVDGNGQRELAEAIVGLRKATTGSVTLDGKDVTRLGVRRRAALGIAFIPEDRRRDGLVLGFTIEENLTLAGSGGAYLDRRESAWKAQSAIVEFGIAANGPSSRAATLSGGNQQKLVVARALSGSPSVVVAMQPARGLDVAAMRQVYARLTEASARGAAVLVFSLDLDEILGLADRIAVMARGRVVGLLDRADATPAFVGRLMVAGADPREADHA